MTLSYQAYGLDLRSEFRLPGMTQRDDRSGCPLALELTALGAFRADVSGAGPTVYGLFRDGDAAAHAAAVLGARGRTWVTRPAW